MNENNLIKIFITKCISHVKYKYYAKQSAINGFESESDEIEEIAKNEIYHAFALLDKLGFSGNVDFLEDMEIDEKKQIEQCQEELGCIYDVDQKHLQKIQQLKEERNSEIAYKTKKCTLCGYLDKSGKRLNNCPKCNNKTFDIN